MVSIKSLAVATLAVAHTAMGKIDTMTAPAEAAAGSNITATFQTSIYSQNCKHHSSPSTDPCLSCFGMFQNATIEAP
jgi:hypothetical protein